MNLKVLKIYYPFWIVAITILAIGFLQNNSENNTLDINVYDTYYVIAHLHVAAVLSLAYFLLGIGYWLVQKVMKRKLIKALTIVHAAILFGSFLIYWIVVGYYNLIVSMPFLLDDGSGVVNMLLMISFLLIVFVAQPLYVINLLVAIFRKRDSNVSI